MRLLILLGGMALCTAAVNASAQPTPLRVRSTGCGELDSHELVRLTRLELGAVASESLEVAYRCEANLIAIDILDRDRDVRVSRELPRDCCTQSAERTLALLAAGLYAVSGPMLHAPAPRSLATDPRPPATDPSAAPAPSVAANGSANANQAGAAADQRPAAIVAASSALSPWPTDPQRADPQRAALMPEPPQPPQPAKQPASQHDIGATTQVRLYNVGSGLTSYGARVRYLYWITPELALGPIAEADFGSIERMGGGVSARVFHLGASTAWRFARGRWAEARIAPFAALSLVQLQGVAGDASVRGGSLSGATGATGLRLGSWLGQGPLRLDASAEGGVLFRAPRGEVADQGVVQLDGLWLGVGLGIDLSFDDAAADTSQARPTETARFNP